MQTWIDDLQQWSQWAVDIADDWRHYPPRDLKEQLSRLLKTIPATVPGEYRETIIVWIEELEV